MLSADLYCLTASSSFVTGIGSSSKAKGFVSFDYKIGSTSNFTLRNAGRIISWAFGTERMRRQRDIPDGQHKDARWFVCHEWLRQLREPRINCRKS